MNNNKIYYMNLHEEIEIVTSDKTRYSIIRVPCGWIYKCYETSFDNPDVFVTSQFIEFHDEFK